MASLKTTRSLHCVAMPHAGFHCRRRHPGRRTADVLRGALVAVVLLAVMGGAGAQTSAPAGSAGQIHPGTESTAKFPLPDSHGGTLTVRSGMPAQLASFGPPPPFDSLDTNRDGRLSEAEAAAYPPLDSDFLYASGGAKSISKARYEKWAEGAGAR